MCAEERAKHGSSPSPLVQTAVPALQQSVPVDIPVGPISTRQGSESGVHVHDLLPHVVLQFSAHAFSGEAGRGGGG